MHYYKRNIGDYAKKAGRLSMLQHGSYTLLIDSCYDREQFPTMDEAIEWTWASSAAEIEAVEFVLRKFFRLEDGVYVQPEIRDDLADYQSKAEKNKKIAIDRETNRKANSTKRAPVVNEPPPNHKPITNNHKPEEETQPATEHAATTRCVRSVDLSIAFRASGILTQPANPVLIELAEQGVQIETVYAACEAAKEAKPGEQVSLGYVVAILKRWAKEAAQTKVAGAAQPRASPGRPASRQSGFEQLDYNEGIEDGRIT